MEQSQRTDAQRLDTITAAIKGALPNAVAYDVSSTDQSIGSGYSLDAVVLDTGEVVELSPWDATHGKWVDELDEDLMWLRWGSFGDRNKDSAFRVDLATNKIIRPARFVATINVPGYLPMDDDPPTFDAATDAWAWLADERREAEDATDDEDYSSTVQELDARASAAVGASEEALLVGSIHGDTPGSTSEHDLGLVYSVAKVDPTN